MFKRGTEFIYVEMYECTAGKNASFFWRICSYSQTKYLRQNECCHRGISLIKFQDDMDFDFLDFEVNSSAEPVARNQFDHEGSLDQVLQET